MRLPRFFLIALVAITVMACQSRPHRAVPATGPSAVSHVPTLLGDYDSYQQSRAGSARWQVSIRALPVSGWLLWTATVDSKQWPSLLLPMQLQDRGNGQWALTPHQKSASNATVDSTFDPRQWRALDACALRNDVASNVSTFVADRAACALIAPALGESAALLPVALTASAQSLSVRSFADSAVDQSGNVIAHRVRWFDGWAAVLGGGAQANAASGDWHMNRELRIGSEGGRVALRWRDGEAAGYSLVLERLAVQGGELPLLKLSIVDANDQVIAYSWAAQDSERIGISLGWIQIGLEARASKPR